jgi:phosphate transport system permease protein
LTPSLARPRRRRPEGLRLYALGGSLLTALFFLGLGALLVRDSLPVLRQAGLGYLTGDVWYYRRQIFGALSMVHGTAVVTLLALLLAAPVGLGTAVFTATLLPPRARIVVKGLLELLAGVPSVVYGLLGVLLLRTFMYERLEPWGAWTGDSLATAGVLLAVMVLPTFVTLADDALGEVPQSHRLAARALGLTRTETLASVLAPTAMPGLVAALLLALGRALGETIAVFLVVGRQDKPLPESLLALQPLIEPGQTLTSKLGGSETFLAMGDPLHWSAMLGLALLLLGLVLAVTVAGARLEVGFGRGEEEADA